MEKIIVFIVSLFVLLWPFAISGGLVYSIATYLIPDKYRNKFYDIVPLYPKRRYAIILYTLALILYILFILLLAGGFVFELLFSLISMIISSQIIKIIAKLCKESVEESFQEEIERKRKMS
jgi:fatty-acid desaturase